MKTLQFGCTLWCSGQGGFQLPTRLILTELPNLRSRISHLRPPVDSGVTVLTALKGCSQQTVGTQVGLQILSNFAARVPTTRQQDKKKHTNMNACIVPQNKGMMHRDIRRSCVECPQALESQGCSISGVPTDNQQCREPRCALRSRDDFEF